MIFDELWKERRKRSKLDKFYDRLISRTEKEKNHEEAENLSGEFMAQRDGINEKINVLETIRLRKESEKLGIPVPPLSDKESWVHSPSNVVFLNVEAQLQLRREIRKERRERLEDRTLWISRILSVWKK